MGNQVEDMQFRNEQDEMLRRCYRHFKIRDRNNIFHLERTNENSMNWEMVLTYWLYAAYWLCCMWVIRYVNVIVKLD